MSYQDVVKPKYIQKTAGSSATQLYAPQTDNPKGEFPTYFSVVVKNMDATNSIFVGSDKNVTADTGFEVKAGEVAYLPCNFLEDLYVVSSGSAKVCAWARFSPSAAPYKW